MDKVSGVLDERKQPNHEILFSFAENSVIIAKKCRCGNEIQLKIERPTTCYDTPQPNLELLKNQHIQHRRELRQKEISCLYEPKNDELLVVKRRKLNRARFHCRFWEKEIRELREKNLLSLRMRQKIFYRDLLKFARAWLEQKQQMEQDVKAFAQIEIQEVRKEIRSLVQLPNKASTIHKNYSRWRSLLKKLLKLSAETVENINFVLSNSGKTAIEDE